MKRSLAVSLGLGLALGVALAAGGVLQTASPAQAQTSAAPRTFDELRERCRALGIAIPARIETVGPAALARATTPEELRALCQRLNYEMGGAGAPVSPSIGGRGAPPPPPPPPPPPRTAPPVAQPSEAPAPAPAAPAAGGAGRGASGSRVFMGSSGAGAPAAERAAPPPVGDSRIRGPVGGYNSQAQAGLLTAGDYDDVLNPAAYAEYVRKFIAQPGNRQRPWVDTEGQLKVTVVDRRGAPVPFANVTTRSADGTTIALRTVADGSVVLFPDVDNLPSTVDLSVSAPGNQNVFRQRVTGVGGKVARKVTVNVGGTAQPVKALDLLLVIDTTGSMGDELRYLQTELRSIVAKVTDGNPGLQVRVGLVLYRDVGDQYVLRSFPFTADIAVLQRQLAAQSAGGGGDEPEAMEQAIGKILDYPWREDAARVALLIADAPPHDNKLSEAWKLALLARTERVHITSVAASGINPNAEFLMRGMAAVTQTRYLFLTDDSGVGNAHAEPSVACYVVTRLDGLIERVVASLVTGRRVEPAKEQIIRSVGEYDSGVCRVPADYAPNQQR